MNYNRRLGFWSGPRLNSLWSWMITLLVIMGSIRGVIVLNSEVSASLIYRTTAVSLLILAAYGVIKSTAYRNPELASLKLLLKLNMLLGILNVAIDCFLGVPFEPSFLYLYLAPYVVFIFLRVPTFYLNVTIVVITIGISYSVLHDFYKAREGVEGYERVVSNDLKLRPETFEGLSRTGEVYRAAGYTGNCHDSANILGMTASFFFIRFLQRKKMLDLGLFLSAVISLTLTQSAVNIVVAIFTCTILAGYLLVRTRKVATWVYLLMGVVGITALIAFFGDVISVFTARIGSEGDWEGMKNQLDAGSLWSAMPFMVVGHATGFGSESRHTEIGLLKGVLQLGFIHAGILYWVLLYPIFRFVRVRTLCSGALPAVGAILFGFLSLLHYGSVLRVTSVFLFYTFCAMCLREVIDCCESVRLAHSLRQEAAEGENRRDFRN